VQHPEPDVPALVALHAVDPLRDPAQPGAPRKLAERLLTHRERDPLQHEVIQPHGAGHGLRAGVGRERPCGGGQVHAEQRGDRGRGTRRGVGQPQHLAGDAVKEAGMASLIRGLHGEAFACRRVRAREVGGPYVGAELVGDRMLGEPEPADQRGEHRTILARKLDDGGRVAVQRDRLGIPAQSAGSHQQVVVPHEHESGCAGPQRDTARAWKRTWGVELFT
jgi:hypothetical protein